MPDDRGTRLGVRAARRLAQSTSHVIGPGLTPAEFARIEADHGFEFADDHRAFLAEGLPLNSPPPAPRPDVIRTHARPWPDWRAGDPDELRERLDRPTEGILFDVEHNAFWHASWGERPPVPAESVATARRMLARVPRMIPVYGHRYLPAGRGTYGHPVLSIWQTDIISYGSDLPDYIAHEFGPAGPPGGDRTPEPAARSTLPFWRDFR